MLTVPGGAAGIGALIGTWLASSGTCNVVLIGRTGRPDPRMHPHALSSLDAKATCIMRCDVTDRAETHDMLLALRRQHAAITAVHAGKLYSQETGRACLASTNN